MNQQELRERKLQILDETVKYYSEDLSRRALDENFMCMYKTPEGKMCAVGRCMRDDAPFKDLNTQGELLSLEIIRDVEFKKQDKKLDTLLKDKYKGVNIEFWMTLQSLHDQSLNWESGGLSEMGEVELNRIKSDIEKGEL